ncbi:copper resistance system multicopper oxidase [Nitrosomonas eutropha]|uniref:copper resistance system multicopper oxidase n=1 Tax=Nitrosomonas eutropha TaxID=916 RepID=UPI0008AEC95E|nr:copper resistance system multicopper oxidase [Nitrosomonas eutropha]SEJ08076.1 copper-resistance protein, CopA family [Nitrosomonas eutropha]
MNRTPLQSFPALSRRRFVQGLVAGGVLTALSSFGYAGSQHKSSQLKSSAVLTGHKIDLIVAETPVNFTGVTRMATTINGSIPAPTLHLQEGDEVTIRVTNHLPVATSIHWHGIILPYQMDGVPGISFKGIAPGETFTYQFKLQQSGTYWYHSHSSFQEMSGMYGALIIKPRNGERIQADRDYVVQLSDWTDDPQRAFSKLKIQSDIYNFNQPTFFDFTSDVSKIGLKAALQKRQMWNEMRMSPTDLSDLSAAALTFLMNGTTPAGNWSGIFKRGERVRLRFINAASNTYYDVRIPGLKLSVVQADGQDVVPVSVDEFRFGPGETYDVVVEPKEDAYTIFAQSIERSGYARGTLALQPGLAAVVPAVDPLEWLTMEDMMGDMAMDHSKHDMQHGAQNPLAKPSKTINHASTEYGPSVDMRVDMPRTNLDDPGIGLRNNGRRVLTFADLKSVAGVLDDHRLPVREIELHLTGNMRRYSWSFDGLEFGKSTPVSLHRGERVRIILQNDTMMTHPIHLHGMWSDLETGQGELLARRHTITVQPAQRISFLTTPHDLGRWAWHCHLLFHMDAGMFREVIVS